MSKKYYIQDLLDIETKYPKELLYVANGTRDILWLIDTVRCKLTQPCSYGNSTDYRSFYYHLLKMKHNLFSLTSPYSNSKYSAYQDFNLNYLYPLYDIVDAEIIKIKKFLNNVSNNEVLKNIFNKSLEIFQILKKDKKYETMLIYNIDYALRNFGEDNKTGYYQVRSQYQNLFMPLDNLNESMRKDSSVTVDGKTLFPIQGDEDDTLFKSGAEMLITDILRIEVETHIIIKLLDQMIKFASKELNNKSYLTDPKAPNNMDKALETEIRKSVEDSLIKMKTVSLKMKQKIRNLFRHELLEDKLFNIENYVYNDK